MRSLSILLSLSASLVPAALAVPTIQLPDLVIDPLSWSTGHANSDGSVHASSGWTFVDCGVLCMLILTASKC
jgi:hypothetical protein